MATVKYTGARYLLKFEDEWEANKEYEPLVALRYNDASYISKQPVPATIGAPDENTDYWAYWGSGDVAFEELRELVLSYDDKIDENNEELNARMDALTNDYEGMFNTGVFMLSQVKGQDAGLHEIYYSSDGKNFNFVTQTNSALNGLNSNALFKWGDWYYHSNGDLCRRSRDLINWGNQQRIDIDRTEYTQGRVWAGTFFYHPVEDKTYFLASREYQEPSTELYTQAKARLAYFDIVAVEVTQDPETGAVSKVPNSQQTIIRDVSHIDPSCVYASSIGCVLACKNEVASNIEIYIGANLNSLSKQNATNPLVGIEAPQLITNGKDCVGLYVEGYYPHTVGYNDNASAFDNAGNYLPRCNLYTPIYIKGELNATYYWTILGLSNPMAHPGYILADSTLYKMLSEHKPIRTSKTLTSTKRRMIFNAPSGANTGYAFLTNIPKDWIYSFGGAANPGNPYVAEIIKIFEGDEPINCVLLTPATNVPTYTIYFNQERTVKVDTSNLSRNQLFNAINVDYDWVFPTLDVQ